MNADSLLVLNGIDVDTGDYLAPKLALADVAGFLAIVFGPPLAALIQVLYANLIATNTVSQPQESAFDLLFDRLARLRR